jgi:hypothetical protein
MIAEGSKVVVESSLVPDYNGLTGEVTLVKGDVWDPSSPVQYRVKADPTVSNELLLQSIGSPYIDLARPWNFWFVSEELREV